ncbi:hypothetical protein Pcinc_011858 [Petrolisthes cinctipes]|uniref:Uncharacterized protein n=2 Tax=Petrolisthes cinctipes TaxID=88211 RepID=A0AAE1KU23_PETCI|nr:hypothetical protein Pcinc_011858 [Petrolisthes cinctipes]
MFMWILSFDATCHAYTTRSTSPATLAPTQPSVRHPPTNLTPLLPTPPPFYHTTQQLFPDTHTQAPLLPLPTTPYLSYLCLVPTPGTPRNRTPSLTALTRTLTNTNTPPPYLTPPQTPFLHLLNLLPRHAKPLHLTPYLPLPHLHLSSLNQPYLPPHTVIHTKRCSLLPTLTHLTPTSPTTSCASQPPYQSPATWIEFCFLHFLSYDTDLGISPLAVREVQC